MKPARWSLVRPAVAEVATAAAEGVAAVVMVVAAEAVAAATAVAVRAAAVAAMVAVVKAAATAGGAAKAGFAALTAFATALGAGGVGGGGGYGGGREGGGYGGGRSEGGFRSPYGSGNRSGGGGGRGGGGYGGGNNRGCCSLIRWRGFPGTTAAAGSLAHEPAPSGAFRTGLLEGVPATASFKGVFSWQQIGLAALARPAGEQAVQQRVRRHAQQCGHHPHLPGDDLVAQAGADGPEGTIGKVAGRHQKRHTVAVRACQRGVDIARQQRHHAHPLRAHLAAQAFAVADHRRFAGAVRAMSRQAPDAGHAADADQCAAAPPGHRVHEGLECGGHADVVGGKGARHHFDVVPLGRVHAHADAGVGDDHIRQALAGNAVLAGGDDALCHCDICAVNFMAAGADSCCAGPGFDLGRSARHQGQAIARAMKAQGQRLANAAGGAGDEDQGMIHGGSKARGATRRGARGAIGAEGAMGAMVQGPGISTPRTCPRSCNTWLRWSYSMPSAVKRSRPRVSVTGWSERTRSAWALVKACRNSLRISSRGRAGVPGLAGKGSRVTMALPKSCTCEPSALLSARLAVATVIWPSGLIERICAWSISNMPVSG